MILEYKLKKEDTEKAINQIVQEQFDLSSRLLSKLIRNKKISINDKIIDTRATGQLGDKLSIDLNYSEDNSNIIATKMELNILYEDDCFLILDKPARIPIHPSMMHYNNTLSNGVKYYFDSIKLYKKIRPVNRIDSNTSGITIFAKNEYIQEHLIKQMAINNFKKEYIAVVSGSLEKYHSIIDAPIARKENSIIERCISPEGQKSITEYEVLNEYIKDGYTYSLIKCKLLTGRTHQIRVHMAHIGHPLIGDTLYGASSKLINRQALHSSKVCFIHPIAKTTFEICCNLPNDIQNILK